MAGVSHLGEDTKGKKTPRGSRHGMARSTHRPTSSSSHRLEDQDIDITYLTEDFIDLGDILAEQLQLQIPYKPLCNADPDRKGKACHPSEEPTGGIELEQKIADRMFRESPFSVLKGIKVKDSR